MSNKIELNKQQIQDNDTFKELICRLKPNGDLEAKTNAPLTLEEALYMIIHLEVFCCENLDINPIIFHTDIQNMLINFLFNEENETDNEESEVDSFQEELKEEDLDDFLNQEYIN